MIKISFNHIMPPVFILLITACLLFITCYASRKERGRYARFLVLINILSVLFILSMIFKPEVSIKTSLKEKAALCILLDTSLSMGIADRDGKTRLEKAKEFIKSDPFFKDYDISLYTMGKKVVKTETEMIDKETPSQNASFILNALEEINKDTGDRYKSIFLFTDGQESRVEEMQNLVSAFNLPVFVAGIGGDIRKDISITGIMSNSPVYTGESARIEVLIRQTGFNGRSKRVLLKENNRIIQEKEVVFSGINETTVFEIPAASPGQKIYEVEIPPEDEETKVNNKTPVYVRVLSPKISVLYVESSLRWEYKFLKRYVESNPNLLPVFLVRVGENIFHYAGEKKIDVPPDIFADSRFLEKFSIIILGDISFASFTPQQRKNIRDFYAVKGRSLVFLGGESFTEGVKNTEIDEVIPVLLNGEEKKITEERFVPLVTDEGNTLPVFSGMAEGFPPLSRINNVYSIKSGAVPLLVKKGNLTVVLAGLNTSAEGGKSLFVGTDDTWRWAFGSEKEKAFYRFFWGRLIRYLWTPEDYLGIGKSVPIILTDKKSYATGQKIEVTFNYTDEKKEPFESLLRTPEGKNCPLPLSELKTFFVPETEGIYIIEAASKGKTNTSAVLVRKEGDEFMDTERNEELLKQIAELSGGSYIPFEDLEGLKNLIKKEKKHITRNLAFTRSSIRYIIFLLFVMLNLGWHLRRQTDT